MLKDKKNNIILFLVFVILFFIIGIIFLNISSLLNYEKLHGFNIFKIFESENLILLIISLLIVILLLIIVDSYYNNKKYLHFQEKKEKKVIAYGTFDLLTPGHIALLKYAKSLGNYLIVAISTDEFNAIKHKHSYLNYEERKIVMESIKYVDKVIPEKNWEQKIQDIKDNNIDILVMGSDWEGSDKFKYLEEYCDVVFFKRVDDYSSTNFRNFISEHNN